jgi:hypothetical protein
MVVSNSMPQQARATHPAHAWWVQVGEFRNRKAANQRVIKVSRTFGGVLENAQGGVEAHHRVYRARFSGLTETAARQTCSAVKSHGLPCMASQGV